MNIKNINFNSLRVFEAVYRHGNMTLAAKELGMTQSGVSQHIKNLESESDIVLFERVKKRIISTKSGDLLYEKFHHLFHELEESLIQLSKKEKIFEGNINVGVPIEFGNNLVLPKLSEIRTKMPGITYKINYGHAMEMNDLLMEGKIDFAFVDSYKLDPTLVMKEVYNETLVLCCTGHYFDLHSTKKENKKFFEDLDYVAYLENAPVIRDWFAKKYHFQKMNLNVVSRSMDVQGIATLIANHMGVGVLPLHAIKKYEPHDLRMKIFGEEGEPVRNRISLAYHPGKYRNSLVRFIVDYLLSAFESFQ
jgi:DNA-binding transcriptional LysR family regulator